MLGNGFGSGVGRVLFCIGSATKMDERPKHIHEISKILMPSQQKVCVILTKCNTLPFKAKAGYKDSWK